MQSPISYLQKNPKFDGFLLTKKENIQYCTGFAGSFGLFLQTKKEAFLISDARYTERAKACANKTKSTFICFDKNFKEKFGKKFSGNFAIEDSTPVSQLTKLKKLFPKTKFTTKPQIIEPFRRNKTEEEIKKIKTAQAHVDKILLLFLKANLKSGITEQALAFDLEGAIRDRGKLEISFDPIVAFGKNSAIPHHKPNTTKLKPGDTILIDCGAKKDDYCSDMTRTFAYQTATPEFQNQYNLLQQAQEKTLQKYKAGTKTKDLDNFCRKQLKDQAKHFTHSLGHGVGLEIHEAPTLSQKSKDILCVGDVVTCEPGLYYPGKFGVRIEDLVVIQKHEPDILSLVEKDLVVLD